MVFRKWIAGLLVLLAVFSYGWRLNDKSVDFDERYTLNMITGLGGATSGTRSFGTFIAKPLSGNTFTAADYWKRFTYSNTISTAISDNGQGIPYLLLLHSWFRAVPVTVFNARLPSVVFLVLAGWVLWLFLRRKLPLPATLIAIALVLFNGLLLDLAQYIRFYTLGILLAVLSLVALHRLVTRRGPTDALWLGCIWAVFLLNHYFAALVIAGQGLYLLLQERSLLKPRIWLTGFAGFTGLLALWLFGLGGIEAVRSVFQYHGQSTQSETAWFPVLTFYQAGTGLAANLATLFGAATQPQPGFKTALNIALALPGWLLCVRAFRKSLPPFQTFCVRLGALILGVQLAFVTGHLALTGKSLLLVPRYWVFCLPFCALWLAIAISSALQGKGWWRLVAIGSLLALGARFSLSIYTATSGKGFTGLHGPQCLEIARTPDVEGIADIIRQRWQPGDTVVFSSWPYAQYINWFWRKSPQIVQQVDTTQADFVRFKTPSGTRSIPWPLGRPLAARPCY